MLKVKERKKSKLKKALLIIAAIIIAVIAAAAIYINAMTKPMQDTDVNKYVIGGMVYSDTVDYQYESGKGIRHNPIIKMMQVFWRMCQDGDKATHAEQTPPDGIHEEVNISYIDDGNIFHLLDVYYPEGADPSAKLPVIIDIHGGGWMYGDKDLNKYYCLELANRGYVVFNISYRLAPDVTVNEELQDCAEALKWISENIESYPCDRNKILLTGDSAGGQLCAYSAVLLQSSELRNTFDVVDGSLDISAVLLTSPVAFMKDAGYFGIVTKKLWGSDYKSKQTYNYMDLSEIIDYADFPPTYLITSGGDALAHEQTHRAYELLREKGIKCEIADFGDDENGEPLPHVFSVLHPFDESGAKAIDGALEFYQEVLKEAE